MHTGEPQLTEEGYVGIDVHIVARVAGSGHGGQIVASQSAREAIDTAEPRSFRFRDLGAYHLSGLPEALKLYQLEEIGGTGAEFPPLRAERIG